MARRTDATATDGTDAAEVRKVQLSGGSTYTVSLPKDWADQQGIEAGTEVYVRPHGDESLVIRNAPVVTGDEEMVRLRTDGREAEDLARAARAMYVAGCDAIEFVAEDGLDPAACRAIEEAVAVLVGAEVVEQVDDRLVVRGLLGPEDVSIHQSVLQLRHVSLSMHEQATAALFDGLGEPRRVVNRDDEADRLFAMVARYFNRGIADPTVVERLGVDHDHMFEYYRVARQLERVGDHAEKLASIAAADGGSLAAMTPVGDRRPAEALKESAATARDVVRDASAPLLGDADTETAYEALRTRDAVLEELERLDRSFHRSDVDYRVSLVVDSLVRTAEHGGNVAETAIQTTARTDDD